MKEYERLLAKREEKWKQLRSLVRHVKSTTGDAVRDTGYNTSEYEEYADPVKAEEIKKEIEIINNLIDTYPTSKAKFSEKEQERFRKYDIGKIMTSAKEAYDQEMKEYMEMNFWGKAKTMFAGKKPKTKATDAQIIKEYGEEAKVKEMQGELKAAKEEYEKSIEWLKEYYKAFPKELSSTIENRLELAKKAYAEKLREIEERNNSYLEEANEVVRTGAVKL